MRRAEPSLPPTFAEACDEWLRHGERERQLKPSTLVDYRASISARLLAALGSLRVDEIAVKDLETFRDGLLDEGEISHRTINKLLMIVGAVLERARRRGLISGNPARASSTSSKSERTTISTSTSPRRCGGSSAPRPPIRTVSFPFAGLLGASP